MPDPDENFPPVDPEALKRIAAYEEFFSQRGSEGTWNGEERGDSDVIQLPYLTYPETVHEFLDLISSSGFQVVFDWPKWEEGRRILSNGAKEIRKADLTTLRKLLTAILRSERFCEGTLHGAIYDGTVSEILRRLRILLEREERVNDGAVDSSTEAL